ncbi:MAG: hypothetical protein KJS97_05395 [Alphaproteobacteria bacterium]|nr:hypothetical protein [Alphaproteobacteria bacterium]
MPSRRNKAAALAAGALFAVAGPAFGQDAGAPIATTPAPAASAPETPPIAPPAASAPIIAVVALPQLDAWASGALSPSNGGLPPTLWDGSDPAALGAVFDEAPRAYGSPTAAALALRALTSSGRAPGGGGPAATEAVRKRYGALGRLGAAEALAGMVTGQAAADPAILQFGVQAELARGRDDAACGKAEGLLVADPVPAFALRMRAFCLARSGDAAGAELALEIGRQANAVDPAFAGAIQAMLAPVKAPPAGKFDTSFNVAVSLAAKLKPGPNALNASSSLALVRLARDAGAPTTLRYGAAVMALRFGLIDGATARAAVRASLDAAAPATPAKKGASAAPKATSAATPVQPLALALKAVETAEPGPARARALAAALRRAETPGAYLATARLFAADLAQVTPAADLADVAPAFVKASLTVGATERAAAWADLAPPATRGAVDAIFAAAGRADLSGAIDRRIAASANSAPAAARDVTLLAALGAPQSETAAAFARANAPPATAPADAARVAALKDAQARGARGETALRAAALLGDGAQRLDAETLATVIRTLQAAGFEAEARAAAIEAMTAGLPG